MFTPLSQRPMDSGIVAGFSRPGDGTGDSPRHRLRAPLPKADIPEGPDLFRAHMHGVAGFTHRSAWPCAFRQPGSPSGVGLGATRRCG